MTREEAIRILKGDTLFNSREEQEAKEMAISSLEVDEAYQLEYEQPEFCTDCISRAEVLKLMKDNWHTHDGDWAMQESMDDIRALPSVTPQEPFINKPCVSEKQCEHDKNVVLDKIRAEIAEYGSIWVEYKITGRRDIDIEQLVSNVLKQAKRQVLEVIDKYKSEIEPQESENT